MTFSASGRVGRKDGTSFAAPRVNGILARILYDDENLSIPDALNQLAQGAQSINDPLFAIGYLGSGVVLVEEILVDKGDRPKQTTLGLNELIRDRERLLASLREGSITAQEIINLPSGRSYFDDPLFIIAEHKIEDPLIKPLIVAGIKSQNLHVRNECLKHTWVYSDPEVIPVLCAIAKSEKHFTNNPAYIIVDKGLD